MGKQKREEEGAATKQRKEEEQVATQSRKEEERAARPKRGGKRKAGPEQWDDGTTCPCGNDVGTGLTEKLGPKLGLKRDAQSFEIFSKFLADEMYLTQNRNRTIGSNTVDQILYGSAVITCLLSRSRNDRGFLNRTHLTYVKANNQARNNKCMNRHFQLKEHTEILGLKRATPDFYSVLSVPDLASP